MEGTRARTFLFVMEMSEGNATQFANLKKNIAARRDIVSYWLPIDPLPMDLRVGKLPHTWAEIFARIPPFSSSWSLQRALYAAVKVRELEARGVHFDAAFFNTPQMSFFLHGFRKRVPSLDSMDCTGEQLREFRKLYNYQPVAENVRIIKTIRRAMIRRTYSGAQHLLPWSSWTAASLEKEYAISPEKISVVPPGIDTDQWAFVDRSLHARQRTSGEVHVLFVGGNFVRKGGDILMRLAAMREFSMCRFHVVTKADVQNAGANVRIYNNLAPNSPELIALYRDADIFFLPTRADFFSIASIEAMATGLPVIVSDVGGIADIVKHGENGLLVPVNDEESFRQALRRVTTSPDERLRMGKRGRTWIEEKFDIRTTSRTVVELMLTQSAMCSTLRGSPDSSNQKKGA